MTSARSGSATRSVQEYASGPLGGVGVGGRRGGSVGEALGAAVGIGVACPLGAVSHPAWKMTAAATTAAQRIALFTDRLLTHQMVCCCIKPGRGNLP
jgi:hypothetical protein